MKDRKSGEQKENNLFMQKEWGIFFNGMAQAAIILDPQHGVIAANKASLNAIGKTEEEILGKRCFELFHGTGHPPETCPCEKIITAGQAETIEMEMETLHGTFLVSCTPVYDDSGRLERIIHVATDITARKKAERALQESEERYRVAIENSSDCVAMVKEGKFIYVNKIFQKTFELEDSNEILNKPFGSFVHPDDRERMINYNKMRNRGESAPFRYEFRAVLKDGGTIYFEASIAMINYKGEKVALAYLRDITDRKAMEEGLKRNEAMLQGILRAAAIGIGLLVNRVFVWVNDYVTAMTGYSKEELIGKSARILYADNEEFTRVGTEKYAEIREKGMGSLETRWMRKDGEIIDVFLSSAAIDPYDLSVGAVFTAIDITSEKHAEQALKESEERYRTAIESSNDGIAIVKGDTHLYVNKRLVQIFGYDRPEDIIGKPLGIVVHPDDVSMVTGISENRIKGEEVPSNYGFKGIKKNGEIVYIEVSASAMMYRGETANIVFLRDVTRRRHAENAKIGLEMQLLQAQKMEAVGQLAGGVAHDFNNILTTIIGYSDLMRIRMDGDDPLRIYVEQVLASAQKAAQLTHSLLAFSRKQVIELKPHNVNDIIRTVQKILARLLTEDIELKTDLADAELMVLVDETQIDQVLMNLATNARDSMPDGGRLYIETRQFSMDNGFVERNAFGKEGDYALISVSDTGIGIDKGMVDKIFEPFFTTKEVGKGTGLGLAIVYGVIKQHNGYINVYSETGKGTRFSIYIPLARIKPESPAAMKESVKGGNETILLAEDNAEVRMLTKMVLESKGYTVIEAIDGEAAIKNFEENKDEIGMVILDVVMPKKNGKEVNEAIQKIKPGIHVLFISGYTADIVFDKGVKDIGINYISKPLLPDELLKKVRAVIDKT